MEPKRNLLRNIKYQVIKLVVPAANAIVSTQDVTTDRNYKFVKGIQITTPESVALERSTFDKFEIDSQEIYPTDFDAQLIKSGNEVNPNQRFDLDIDEPAENSTVNITYRDGGTATAYPYTAKVILKLTNPIK